MGPAHLSRKTRPRYLRPPPEAQEKTRRPRRDRYIPTEKVARADGAHALHRELQRFTAGGVVRTIGTGVYHDELCKGVEVGVSRDAVLAAILERGACASE